MANTAVATASAKKPSNPTAAAAAAAVAAVATDNKMSTTNTKTPKNDIDIGIGIDIDTVTRTRTRTRTPHPFTRLQNPSKWEIAKMILGLVSGIVPIRFVLLVFSLVTGVSITVFCHSHLRSKYWTVVSLRMLCRWLLFIAGFYYITVVGELPSAASAAAGGLDGDDDGDDDGDGDGCSCSCPKIVVCNHMSNMEILHLLTLPFVDSKGNPVLPVFVTKESVFRLPFIGRITRDVLGSIGVSRRSSSSSSSEQQKQNGGSNGGDGEESNNNNNNNTNSNYNSASSNNNNNNNNKHSQHSSSDITEKIVERVRKSNSGDGDDGDGSGPIAIFPEGTTTNGTCLLTFKKGAFVPMVDVLPIVYSFSNNYYNNDKSSSSSSSFLPTYESIWAPAYLWRLLCQPVNYLKCEILKPIHPPRSTTTNTNTNTNTNTSTTNSTSTSTSTSTSSDSSAAVAVAVAEQEQEQKLVALFASTVRSTMAKHLNIPMVVSETYNYRHKLNYHDQLRKVYKSHPRGPIYAMCFEPMQKVLLLLPPPRPQQQHIQQQQQQQQQQQVVVEDYCNGESNNSRNNNKGIVVDNDNDVDVDDDVCFGHDTVLGTRFIVDKSDDCYIGVGFAFNTMKKKRKKMKKRR